MGIPRSSCGMEFSAASLALFDDDRVLLIQRARAPFLYHWTLPGGRREGDETALHCALREMREETGLVVADAREITSIDVGEGPVGYRLAVFAATRFSGTLAVSDEVADYRWARVEELQDLLVTPHLAEVLATAVDKVAG